jgi:hypothetical protein
MKNDALIPRLQNMITDEIVAALGFSREGLARRLFGPLFWPPARICSKLIAGIEKPAQDRGLPGAASYLLPRFVQEVQVHGEETIPQEGPLIVASNHPGAYDALAILSRVLRRDIKIIVSDVPILRSLPSIAQHMIYTPPNLLMRMTAVREIIRCMENGGAILIFPSGLVDPDPAFMPGADLALEKWSSSLDLIMKRVPDTKLQITIVSGVLAPTCLRNPITRLPKERWRQQKLAEFLQVIQQLLFHWDHELVPRLYFGTPLTAAELLGATGLPDLHEAIIEKARQVLQLSLDGQETAA